MPILGTPANEVQGTLSASFTRGTDTDIVLSSGEGTAFPSTPQVVRITDGSHWCLVIYSSRSGDTLAMASATDYALPNNVSSGDDSYTWPVGSLVDLIASADQLKNVLHNDVPGEIAAITEKTAPASADKLLIEDSADSNAKKMVQIGNATKFILGADTPSSYAGYAGYSPVVNVGETALEWAKRASITTADMDIYVDGTNGDDSTGDGSLSNPYATVQHAIDSLPAIIAHTVNINVVSDLTISSMISFAGKLVLKRLVLQSQNSSGVNNYDHGTASSGDSTTLTDSSKSWATDQFKGGKIFICDGTGAGQIRDISSNTSDTITVSSAWDTAPDSSSRYIISGNTLTGPSGGTTIGDLPANLSILGFTFTGADTGIFKASNDNGSGRSGLIVKYNVFDTIRRCVQIQGLDGAVEFNYYTIESASNVGIGLTVIACNIISGGSCYNKSGSSTAWGLDIEQQSMLYPMYVSRLEGLTIGLKAQHAGAVRSNASGNFTFVSCTTNADPAPGTESSYTGIS